MREIKFRVWDSENKNMVYDVGICADGSNTPYKIPDGEDDQENYEYYDGAELMQYTGLKDKNGKEIYEGDILKDGWVAPEVFVIVWVDKEARFGEKRAGSPYANSDDYILDGSILRSTMCPVEVIGNIHENSELLGDSGGVGR